MNELSTALDNLEISLHQEENLNFSKYRESKFYELLLTQFDRDFPEYKEWIGIIVSENMLVQNLLRQNGLSYRELIENSPLTSENKDLLLSVSQDFNFLLPIGGQYPNKVDKDLKPNKNAFRVWSETTVIIAIIISMNLGDLIDVPIEIMKSIQETTLKLKEFELKNRELDIKERELDLKELELKQEDGQKSN